MIHRLYTHVDKSVDNRRLSEMSDLSPYVRFVLVCPEMSDLSDLSLSGLGRVDLRLGQKCAPVFYECQYFCRKFFKIVIHAA